MKAGKTDSYPKFAVFGALFQVAFILLFAFCVRYKTTTDSQADADYAVKYPKFQDVHVMMVIGFGFLMTFLKKNAFTAVGINFFLCAFVLQWGTLTNGFWENVFKKGDSGTPFEEIEFDISTMINTDFAMAACLISFGAVIGKASPLQLLFMVFFECIFYSANIILWFNKTQAIDIGGSILIHTFGAYFGLAVSMMITTSKARNNKNNGSMYYNDLFAMVGTAFLWMYWPSFNGAFATGNAQLRVMTNTYMSLGACCVTTFICSMLFRRGHKFDMVDIQNATLAGGVAVGATADLVIHPWGALLIGTVAGALSVLGYVYVQGFLEEKIGLHDTCGVNNLHGMPGLLGGIASGVVAALASDSDYGSVVNFYPGRTTRSAAEQGGYQILATFGTAGIAIVTGLLTGFLLKHSFFEPPNENFNDEDFWHVPLGTEEDPEADPAQIREIKLAKPVNNARSNNFNTAQRRKGGPPGGGNTLRLSAFINNANANGTIKENGANGKAANGTTAPWSNPVAASTLAVPSISVISEETSSVDDIQRINYHQDMDISH